MNLASSLSQSISSISLEVNANGSFLSKQGSVHSDHRAGAVAKRWPSRVRVLETRTVRVQCS